MTLNLIILRIKSLNKVILEDSDRPNRIVQINAIHVKYSVIFFKIFDAKECDLHSKVYIYIHQGITVIILLIVLEIPLIVQKWAIQFLIITICL